MLLNSIIQEVAAMIIKLPNVSCKALVSLARFLLHLSFASLIDELFFFLSLFLFPWYLFKELRANLKIHLRKDNKNEM